MSALLRAAPAGAWLLALAIECTPASAQDKPAALVTADPGPVEEVAPDTSRQIVRAFKADNPDAREHQFGKRAEGYDDSPLNPGMQLERVWSGSHGTLLEITGLPRKGKPFSAMMRKETLVLSSQKSGPQRYIASEGATEIKDQRGFTAIALRPGETLYLLMGPIDDLYPFSLQFTPPTGGTVVYFDGLDPRIRDRYNKAYANATTPETMKDFIVAFAKNDFDNKVPEVFTRLIGMMRAKNTFEGYYNTYLIMQDPKDAQLAVKLARTDEHRAMLENIAVATLADKARLLEFDFKLEPTRSQSGEGGCFMFCRYNFTASRLVRGTLTVRANIAGSPFKLRHGSYTVNFDSKVALSRQHSRRSFWEGNYEGSDDFVKNGTISVTLSPPNYSTSVPVTLANAVVAFFERGSAGGYKGIWATDDARVSIGLSSMELSK